MWVWRVSRNRKARRINEAHARRPQICSLLLDMKRLAVNSRIRNDRTQAAASFRRKLFLALKFVEYVLRLSGFPSQPMRVLVAFGCVLQLSMTFGEAFSPRSDYSKSKGF